MVSSSFAAAGGAAAAAGGGVGIGLFAYNRDNYMVDQKLHYARYVAGYTLAVQQARQYRQDIMDLTDLTSSRMLKITDLSMMSATVLTELFASGRSGLHTPAPPSWLVGLNLVNIASCYIWLGLTIWLAMHASLRANSAATHLLTRFVRVPVPSQKLLDRARKFLASYEEQPFRDVFRIPFMRHPKGGGNQKGSKAENNAKAASGDCPPPLGGGCRLSNAVDCMPTNEGRYNEDMDVDPDVRERTRHGEDVPAWYKMEQAIDNTSTFESMMPYKARGTAPEHYEVFRELQNEWWPYDVYARICIFLAFMHMTHAWTYQQIGHHMQETRSVLAAACVVVPISALQQIILTLDLLPDQGDFPIQHIGPFAQFFAYIAAAIEYMPYWNQGVAVVGYIFVYIAYAIHIIYTMQLIRLCAPDWTKAPPPAEVPSAAWWPASWRLPSNFAHAVWLVAPPRHLEDGQNDLVGEMRNASRGNRKLKSNGWDGMVHAAGKRRDVHRALGPQRQSPAWFSVKYGLLATLLAWLLLILGFSIDIGNQGTSHPSLLSAPGLPHHSADPRYRQPKPGSSTPTEVGTGGIDAGPAVGVDGTAVQRRLMAGGEQHHSLPMYAISRAEVLGKLNGLLALVGDLASTKTPQSSALPSHGSDLIPVDVRWPAMFSPRLMACAPPQEALRGALAVVLSHSGRGTIIMEGKEGLDGNAEAEFALQDIGIGGKLFAASWDEFGLLLLISSVIYACPGAPISGRWRCHQQAKAGELQEHGGEAVAVARVEENGSLWAAVSFPREKSMLILFKEQSATQWERIGQVQTPSGAVSMTFENLERLLLTFADGSVAFMSMSDGSFSVPSVLPSGSHRWLASCSPSSLRLARLGLELESRFSKPRLFLEQLAALRA